MPTAYSYMRFSTPEQAKGDSRRRQTQLAVDYAKANGLVLDDKLTYRDFGVSAFRGANVTIGKLGQFIEAIRKNEVKAGSFLLVESLDRISRDHILPAQSIFTQIILAGVTIVTLIDKRIYSAESVNKFPFLLIEAIIILIRANEESESRSQRLQAAWQNKRDNISTKIFTPTGPAWLKYNKSRKKFEIIPERAAIIDRIFKEFIAGKGYINIAKGLSDDGVPTWSIGKKKLSRWHDSYIRRIIKGTCVIGTLTLHKIDYSEGYQRRVLSEVKDYYPSVITEDMFSKVQEIHRVKRMKGMKISKKWRSVFAGIGKCTKCGASLFNADKDTNKRWWRFLVCPNATNNDGCDCKPILYPRLEFRFLKEFKRALDLFTVSNIGFFNISTQVVETKQKLEYFVNRRSNLLMSHHYCSNLTIDFLNQRISNLKNDLNKMLSDAKYLQLQRMYSFIDELSYLIQNNNHVDRLRVNYMMRFMCDYVLISTGKVEVKFKSGPKLLIEYTSTTSSFRYNDL